MLIITFQALSCSLHFPINIRPGACLETTVVTPCIGGIFLLLLFFWELELTHLAISIPSPVLAVLSLKSRVTCHQMFPGMGFRTFMHALWPKYRGHIFEPTKVELLWRDGRNYLSLSSGCKGRSQATASVVWRLVHLNRAGRSLCWVPECEVPELRQAQLASLFTPGAGTESRFPRDLRALVM